jgi:hypothetical protein
MASASKIKLSGVNDLCVSRVCGTWLVRGCHHYGDSPCGCVGKMPDWKFAHVFSQSLSCAEMHVGLHEKCLLLFEFN